MDAASSSSPGSFALAKIQPPRSRADLVERAALEEALAQALHARRLTLLLAPAGFGKTAALTRQLLRLPPGCALAWMSADEGDQLPRFLACLTAALEPHDLPWRVDPASLATLALAERGLRDAAGEIVNALGAAAATRGLIAIDDAHRIDDPRVFELLRMVIERLPAHWAVVVASRLEPPLPLARWRGAGELAEFRQNDLRFSESDIEALLARSEGAVAGVRSARDLLRRTEGWAAGLRLSINVGGAGAQRALASETQRHVFDYLADEVLADMPRALRDFLLRSSVLPELTAERCAVVTGSPDASRLLEEIERRGLFVSVLEAAEPTLRLHDLFREFLEDRLRRDHPDELDGLLRRAAASEPDLARAIVSWGRAGDWDAAADRLIGDGRALIAEGGARIGEMLALLPAAQFDRRPDLHMLRGIEKFLDFHFEETVASMERAAVGYDRERRRSWANSARAYAALAMQSTGRLADADAEYARLLAAPLDAPVRAFVHFGMAWSAYARIDTRGVAPTYARMLDELEQVDDFQVWNLVFFHGFLIGLPGVTPLAERFARGAARVGGDVPTPLRSGVLHARAWIEVDRGRLEEAGRTLAEVDKVVRWIGAPRSVVTENAMAHVLIDALRGQPANARAAIDTYWQDALGEAPTATRLTHEYEVIFTQLRAEWLLGDHGAVRALCRQLEAAANDFEWAAAFSQRRFARALVACGEGRLDDAGELLRPLAHRDEYSCFFPATQATLLLADCERQGGRLAQAAETLRSWLPQARLGQRLGGALLAGPRVLGGLAAADWQGLLDPADIDVLHRLAARLAPLAAVCAAGAEGGTAPADVDPVASASGLKGPAAAAGPDGLSSLTEREREVLERLAAGDSNKLIARAFDLSPHTVKRHVANILGKLAVDTRGQAAARWREGLDRN